MKKRSEIVVRDNTRMTDGNLPSIVQSIGKAGQQAWRDFFDGKLANKAT